MGKITAPTIVRVNSGEAVVNLDQLIEAIRVLGDAVRGFSGTHKTIEPVKKPRTCSQCGAPLHGNKCEYCNTEY